jgi:hypothetical protein
MIKVSTQVCHPTKSYRNREAVYLYKLIKCGKKLGMDVGKPVSAHVYILSRAMDKLQLEDQTWAESSTLDLAICLPSIFGVLSKTA